MLLLGIAIGLIGGLLLSMVVSNNAYEKGRKAEKERIGKLLDMYIEKLEGQFTDVMKQAAYETYVNCEF